MQYVIEATVLIRLATGELVLTPRIPIVPTDFPFAFKRLQCPVKTCFAITINKSQRQTLKVSGVDFQSEVFSHGQLYVELLRNSSPKEQTILIPDINNIT